MTGEKAGTRSNTEPFFGEAQVAYKQWTGRAKMNAQLMSLATLAVGQWAVMSLDGLSWSAPRKEMRQAGVGRRWQGRWL